MNTSAIVLSVAWILWSGTYDVPGNDKVTRTPNPHRILNPGWIPVGEFDDETKCQKSAEDRVSNILKNPPTIKDLELLDSKSHPWLVIFKYKEHETVVEYRCFPSGAYPKDRNY